MNPTKLSLYYVDLQTQSRYLVLNDPEPGHLARQVRSNPAMNPTYAANPDATDDVFLACYLNSEFVGAFVGNLHPSGYQVEMHTAVDRVNHKDSIKVFAELSTLWCLQNKLFPYLCVPDTMPNVIGWVERTLGWDTRVPMESTRNLHGEEITSSIYIMPRDWRPRYVNNVVSHWS